jgi:hypothetical protein
MTQLKDFNFIFQNMAIGSLNLATCIDPVQLQEMGRVKMGSYVNQLAAWPPVSSVAAWPPVSSEIERVTHNANLGLIFNQNEIPPVQDIISGKYLQDMKTLLIQTLPLILLPSVMSVLSNMTNPDSLSTLPVDQLLAACSNNMGLLKFKTSSITQ